MLLDFGKLLLWLLVCSAVAVVEYSTGLPIITIALIMLAAQSMATVWFFIFTTTVSVILSALFMESWLVVWLIITASALIFRLPNIKSNQMFLTKVSLVLLVALILSFIRQPVVTPLFLIRSMVSLAIASYILWRKVRQKNRSFDISELRFASE